jgi:hypothetical protein
MPIVHILAGLLHDPMVLADFFGCWAGRERIEGNLVPHANAIDLPNHRSRKVPKVSVKHFLVDIRQWDDLVIGWQPATQGLLNLAHFLHNGPEGLLSDGLGGRHDGLGSITSILLSRHLHRRLGSIELHRDRQGNFLDTTSDLNLRELPF